MSQNTEINLRPDFSAHFKTNSKKFEGNTEKIDSEYFSIPESFKVTIKNLSYLSILSSFCMLFAGAMGLIQLILLIDTISAIELFVQGGTFLTIFISGLFLYKFSGVIIDIIKSKSKDLFSYRIKTGFASLVPFFIFIGLSSLFVFISVLISVF